MNDGYIAVLDSGVGGLSVLYELANVLPNEKYLYYGDNKNAPYGNRSEKELRSITFKNLDYIMQYPIKALVLGCNTLSTTIIDQVAEYSGVATFGVFPPVENALIKKEKVLLLATVRTAQKYLGVKNLSVIGFKNLATDIENNLTDLSKVDFELNINAKDNIFNNVSGSFDTVVLGCTHYNFIKNQIINHFRPQNLLSGNFFTVLNLHNFLQNKKSLGNNKGFSINFIGENGLINKKFYENCGQNM